MKKYFIEDVKCGVTSGGMACGPIPGHVVASIKFSDGENTKWINLVEVECIPNVFLTNADVYDKLIDDADDQEFADLLNKSFISVFDGIPLTEYSDAYDYIAGDSANPASALIRYLFAITRCEWDDLEGLISMGKGKYADELTILKTDLELEMEEDEE